MFIIRVLFLITLCWLPTAYADITVHSARFWPAEDYTRLTLESDQPISSSMFTLEDPQRLVIDLKEVKLNDKIRQLTSMVAQDSPYIEGLRVGNFKPGIVRLVLDLKEKVKPELFELDPVGDYGHRLVLDVYPQNALDTDPLLALLKQAQQHVDRPAPTDSPAEPPSDSTPAPSAETTPTDKEPAPADPPEPAVPEMTTRTLIIAIDAGHGGEDPGAQGSHSVEKDITLIIARKLKALIDRQPHMKGVLIRDGDYFIPLHKRVLKARRARADLFVSIHADAFIKPQAHGSSVFALSKSGATSTVARWLAKKENEADLIGGVNVAVKDPHLARTLLDLSQTATINDSLKLGKLVLLELAKINDIHGSGEVEQAGFAVLKSPDIPSILVETAFISNPDEERRLNTAAFQSKMAKAIAKGILDYFSLKPALSKPQMARQ